jgi:uncharacterized protein YwgA
MSIKDAIMATVAAEQGAGLQGRTLLQKKLYFLGVLANEDFGFSPYYYGPYSSVVADELGALVGAGFVDEVPQSLYAVGPYGEKHRYDYELTEDSKSYFTERTAEIEPYLKLLERINAHPVARDSNSLSLAAKVHLILRERGDVSMEEIVERAGEFGWKLSPQQVTNVIEYLRQLDLVSKTAGRGR